MVLPAVIIVVGAIKLTGISKAVSAEAADNVLKVKYFYRTGFDSPKQEAIQKKLKQLGEAKTLVESIESYVKHQLEMVPGDIEEPGVYFKELLFHEQKKLVSLANARGIQLPGDLGFVERLSQAEEVPELLSRLQLISQLVHIMADSDIKVIHEIEFTERNNFKTIEGSQLPASNLTVRVSMDCELGNLSDVLFEIGGLNPVVLVEAMQVTPGKQNLVRADLLVTKIVGVI